MRFLLLIIISLIHVNVLSQNTDTLYIKKDSKLLYITDFHKANNLKYFSIKQDSAYRPEDWFYFSESKSLYGLKPKRITNVKRLLRKANVVYKKDKIDEWAFYNYLDKLNCIIFLVDHDRFVQVEINYFIE